MELLFAAIAEKLDFPLDQVRYLVLIFLSYPLAYIFRYVLHPSHTSLTTRYVYSMSLGLVMGFMCFGWQMFILFGVVGVSYIFLLVLPPNVVQSYTMVWALGCVSAAHVYRMITDYEGWHLDFTGPLMLIVQKLTLFAYAYHDGNARKESSLNDDQKKQKIDECPSLLVYFSYNFNFHSFLAGPTCTIKDYLAFMDGSNLVPIANTNEYTKEKSPPKEPSSLYPVVTKLLTGLVFLTLYIVLENYLPKDQLHLNDQSLSRMKHILFMDLAGMRVRYRFYFIWMLADSINNLAGLGFNGRDELGYAKWDLVTVIYPTVVETSVNLRMLINNFNICTMLWLRRTVYERVKYAPTLQTFCVSAIWHGFYPGYYFSFLSLSLFLMASRKMHSLARPYFQGNTIAKRMYDVITFTVTRICADFCMIPMLVLTLQNSLLAWSHYNYIPIILVLIVVFLFPSGRKSSQDGQLKRTTSSLSDLNNSVTNCIHNHRIKSE